MNPLSLRRSAIWSLQKVARQFNWGRSYLIFFTGIVFNKTTYAYNTAMADVSRLLEVGSREYIQWILKSVSSCWGGGLKWRGRALSHTHMFLKCSNVLLLYCRCITEKEFNNLLYTIPIKLERFSALLFIITVQMSLGYSVCMHSQTPMHRETPTSRALDNGHCLKTPVMFFLNYFIIELSLLQIHTNVALRWVENKINLVIFKSHRNPLLENIFWKDKLMESRDIQILLKTIRIWHWWYTLFSKIWGSARLKMLSHQNLTSPFINKVQKCQTKIKCPTMKEHFCVRNVKANATMYSCWISFPRKPLPLDNK